MNYHKLKIFCTEAACQMLTVHKVKCSKPTLHLAGLLHQMETVYCTLCLYTMLPEFSLVILAAWFRPKYLNNCCFDLTKCTHFHDPLTFTAGQPAGESFHLSRKSSTSTWFDTTFGTDINGFQIIYSRDCSGCQIFPLVLSSGQNFILKPTVLDNSISVSFTLCFVLVNKCEFVRKLSEMVNMVNTIPAKNELVVLSV